MDQLEINNKTIIKINFSELLKYNIITPNIQRILNLDKVNNIVTYQIDYFKNYNLFNILGVINISYNKDNNVYYLVDGQHRYNALEKLYNLGHNPYFFIELVSVNNFEELKNNYNLINKNTLLPDLPENINKTLVETSAIYFKNKYNELWSKTSRSNRPHIYFDYFLEGIAILYTELIKLNISINTSTDLNNIIEIYNNKLKNWNRKNFPESSSITDNMYKKCEKWNLYLGLFKHISDKYRYKWVKNIIYEYTGEIISTNKKKNYIPKKLKIDVWNRYIGKNKRNTICVCCNITEIDITNFHAGHIISEKNEGLINIDNIIPICTLCNTSMSSKNMDLYIQTYYPQNYNNYLNITNTIDTTIDTTVDNSSIYNYWIF